MSLTSPQQVVVMEFGKQHDTTDTTDFCPWKLVMDLLRGNWCNGFWPLHRQTDRQTDRQVLNVKCNNAYSVQNDESLHGHCINSGIRKWEENQRCDLRRQQKMERGGRSDVRWKTVPQTSGCNRKRSVTNSGQTSTSNVQRRWGGRTCRRLASGDLTL